MAFIVEMARGMPEEPDFVTYSCGSSTWKGLLTIARSFGWDPRGTVPDPWAACRTEDYMNWFKSTYDPEEWGYCKRVSDEDARALAAALRRAKAAITEGNVAIFERPGPTLLKDDSSASELERVNSLPTQQMDAFATFAEGGGFAFAWDD